MQLFDEVGMLFFPSVKNSLLSMYFRSQSVYGTQ